MSGDLNVVSIDHDPTTDLTEVQIRVPGFQNFGKGLRDLIEGSALQVAQSIGYNSDKDADDDDEAVRALEEFNNSIMEGMADMMKEQLRRFEEMPEGEEKEFIRSQLEELRLMNEMADLDAAAEDTSDTDDSEEDPDSSIYDPELIRVSLATGTEWDANAEQKISAFLKDWNAIRPQVRKQVFDYYASVRDECLLWETDESLLPEPSDISVIDNLFILNTINLIGDDRFGLSGACSWDDEHGLGIVVQNGKIVSVGHASDVYDEDWE